MRFRAFYKVCVAIFLVGSLSGVPSVGHAAGTGMIFVTNEKGHSVTVLDPETYEVIKTIDAGTQSAGNIEFEWDGKDKHGNQMAPGEYVISATGELNGEGVQLNTAVNRHVGSVSLAGSGQGVILNLDGDVSINLDDVIQIGSQQENQ